MEWIIDLVHLAEYIIFIYFAFAAIYVFIFSFAAIFPSRKAKVKANEMRKMAVLIPGYKEDAVIVDVANDALNQEYPKELYDVVVIADSFRPETINTLKTLPIKLVEVSFEKSTKSKALNKAMETIGNNFDVAVVLDADNLMTNDFLLKINHAFNSGFKVVQGHRVAKNLNTHFAVLDAISEEVNNHIFRKGHRNLGLSSALIGSGMAFDYHLFKTTMANVNAIGGFDKELELKLLRDNIKIEFLNNALVLDEKVQKPEVFANQRKRWLSAQFIYFRRYFFSGLKHLIVRGNVDFFDKVYQMVSPPRVLLLGLTTLFAMVFGFLALLPGAQDIMALQFTTWLALAILVYVSFVLAVPISFYTQKTLIAIFSLPKAFILMLLSLFKLKGANKKFIHTAHGVEK
jgi:cellulose synthase/poly-beta-1,6-N-acetylglucosamine synthase-like glycosyltransferase